MPLTKRLFDVAVAALLLVMSAPLIAAAAVLIRLEDGGPVLYRQMRLGKDAVPFRIVKLRSLTTNDMPPAQVGYLSRDHPAVTRIGGWLRRFKVDELPQLVNVLRGDLSLVGPRPALPEQGAAYTDFERRRLEVKPGLTGWAQVNGNVELPWSDRILLDVWYVDHMSTRLDLEILLRTIGVLVHGERPNYDELERARSHALGIHRGS